MLLTSPHSRRAVVLGAACALLASSAGTARATDLRPRDVRDQAAAVLTAGEDLRSPDARDPAGGSPAPSQDLRSPDARDAAGGSPVPVTVVPVRVSDPS